MQKSFCRNILAAGFLAYIAGQILPVYAFPGTGAPVSAVKKIAPDSKEAESPYNNSFLLDMVKSLARNGLPPSFFLAVESKSLTTGLDLRPLLLFEAGVLKSPLSLLLPAKKNIQGRIPSLSLSSSMPESGAGFPDNGNKGTELSVRPLNSSISRSSAATAENPASSNFSIASLPKITGLGLSLDFNKFQSTEAAQLSGEANFFRLWIVAPGQSGNGALYSKPILNDNSYEQMVSRPYRGSFLATVPGAIQAVEGRVFSIKKDPVLVVARGKLLAINTPLGQISLLPGTSCLVDFPKQDLLRVRALESVESTFGAGVYFKAAGKGEEIRLAAGEQLFLNPNKLNAPDLTIISELAKKQISNSEYWSKSKFLPREAIAKDLFFQANASTLSPEQKSALDELRNRLR